MDVKGIIEQIDSEIARLQSARVILLGSATKATTKAAVKTKALALPKKRVLSAAARKRIGDAQRKRWAATKAPAKKQAAKKAVAAIKPGQQGIVRGPNKAVPKPFRASESGTV